MQLFESNEVIREIKERDINFSYDNLHCWRKDEGRYNIYIFSLYCKNEVELLEIYEEVRDYIAIYFQSQILEIDVERWNIYQYFFIENSISKDVRVSIEQDKFSTRKIVKDSTGKFLAKEEIKQVIYSDLFEFKKIAENITDFSLEAELHIDNCNLLKSIESYDNDYIKSNINNIIEELCNE